jgi:uncharacterized membrane protein YphA (DoxX/SURF4 family)
MMGWQKPDQEMDTMSQPFTHALNQALSQAISAHLVSLRVNAAQRRRWITTDRALWIVQGLLALLFLFAGGMKLIMPIDVLSAQMAVPLPGTFLKFIGFAEAAGAIGLILPGLTQIRPLLTPLAAAGLVIIMVGAAVVTLATGEIGAALFPLVVGLLCAAVAYGRRSWGWV